MRIHRLQLQTHALEHLIPFYQEVLGLEMVEQSESSAVFRVGETDLEFVASDTTTWYHFAINIPSNQIQEAMSWLAERTELLDMEGTYLFDFSSWEAEAMYFYDPAGNIVELIGRRTLGVESEASFSSNSLLHISEMGVAVGDLPPTLGFLEEMGITLYSGDEERFAAMGDERGLFIVVNYHQKKWIPRMDEALPFPFSITIQPEGQEPVSLDFADERLSRSPVK